MSKQIVIIASLCISQICTGQQLKTIEAEKICELKSQTYPFEIKDVEEFKDSLTFKLDISEVTNGREIDKKEVTFSEMIKDESSIIQISKEVAFSISIARVVEKGKKYYIYCIHLYKKEGKCWDDLNANGTWTKCALGSIGNGFGFGNQGSVNFVGFSGNVSLN